MEPGQVDETKLPNVSEAVPSPIPQSSSLPSASSSTLFRTPACITVVPLLPVLTSDAALTEALDERKSAQEKRRRRGKLAAGGRGRGGRNAAKPLRKHKESDKDKEEENGKGAEEVLIELPESAVIGGGLAASSASASTSVNHSKLPPIHDSDDLGSASPSRSSQIACLCGSSKCDNLFHRFVKYVRTPISFRYTLLLLVLAPLVLASVLIWLIGQRASNNIVSNLSQQLRDANIAGMNERISSELSKPLLAAQLLTQSLAIVAPNFANASSLDYSVLALLQQQLYLYIPDTWISNLIVSSYHGGFTVMLLRHMNLTSVGNVVEVTGEPSVSPSDQLVDVVYSDQSTIFAWLQPTLNSSQWASLPVYTFSSPAEPSADPASVLGASRSTWPVLFNIPGHPPLATWNVVSQALILTNWTGPQYNDPSYYAGTKQVQVSVIVSLFDTARNFIGWLSVGILLSLVDQTLQQLSLLGPNGQALIVRSDGLLLSSSVPIPDAAFPFYINSPQAVNTSLPAISQLLVQQGFLSAQPKNRLNLTSLQQSGLTFDSAVSLNNGAYHLSATVVNVTGMDWVLVALTYDNDWNSDVKTQTLDSLVLTAVVVVVAAILALAAAYFLVLPITNLSAFMHAISTVTNRPRPTGINSAAKLAGTGDAVGGVAVVAAGLKPSSGRLAPLSGSHSNSKTLKHIQPLQMPASKEQMRKQIRAVFDTPVQRRFVKRHSIAIVPTTEKIKEALSGNRNVDADAATPKPAIAAATAAARPSEAEPVLEANPTSMSSTYEELSVLCQMWNQARTHRRPSDSDDASIALARQRFANLRPVDSHHCRFFLREISEMESTFKSMLWKLRSSYSKAEKANEARKHFIRYIFHEVRVPLNAMLLAIQHLKDQVPAQQRGNPKSTTTRADHKSSTLSMADPEMCAVIDILHEQANVVVGILNDVLCLQKIEDGRLALDFAEFSLSNLLLSTCESFFAVFDTKRLGLFSQIHPSVYDLYAPIVISALDMIQHTSGIRRERAEALLGANGKREEQLRGFFQIFADRSRIRQVLANFLSNACKFTQSGGSVRIDVEAVQLRSPPPAFFLQFDAALVSSSSSSPPFASVAPSALKPRAFAVLRIAVTDNGCGMSEEDAAQLFSARRGNKFVQVGKGARLESDKVGGSGLGLGISKKLIELHSGAIGVQSKPDVGSTFYFSIPTILSINVPALNHHIVSLENESDVKESQSSRSSAAEALSRTTSLQKNDMDVEADLVDVAAAAGVAAKAELSAKSRAGADGSARGSLSRGDKDSDVSAIRYHYENDKEPSSLVEVVEGEEAGAEGEMDKDRLTPIIGISQPLSERRAPNSLSPPLSNTTLSARSLHNSSSRAFISSDSPLARVRTLGAVGASQVVQPPSISFPVSGLPLSLHVVVVEDSLPNRKLLTMSLKKLGYRVTAFEDGSEVIKFFKDAKDDAIKQGKDRFVHLPASLHSATTGSNSNSHESIPATPTAELPPPSFALATPLTASAGIMTSSSAAAASSASSSPYLTGLSSGSISSFTSSSCPSTDSAFASTSTSSVASSVGAPAGSAAASLGAISATVCDVDIVLMDSNMPKVNGLAATRAIRAMGFHSAALPIVGVTGNALSEDIEEFLSSGANSILTKPIQMNELNKLIHQLCGRKEGDHAARGSEVGGGRTKNTGAISAATALLIRRARSQSVISF